jgi:hypothetical protein
LAPSPGLKIVTTRGTVAVRGTVVIEEAPKLSVRVAITV